LTDPCLFTRKDTSFRKPSFAIIYVDAGGIFGSQQYNDEIMNGLSKAFVIKSLGPIKDFVGCQDIEKEKKDTIWVHQPKRLNNFKKALLTVLPNRKF
jgi:hypothetical protein